MRKTLIAILLFVSLTAPASAQTADTTQLLTLLQQLVQLLIERVEELKVQLAAQTASNTLSFAGIAQDIQEVKTTIVSSTMPKTASVAEQPKPEPQRMDVVRISGDYFTYNTIVIGTSTWPLFHIHNVTLKDGSKGIIKRVKLAINGIEDSDIISGYISSTGQLVGSQRTISEVPLTGENGVFEVDNLDAPFYEDKRIIAYGNATLYMAFNPTVNGKKLDIIIREIEIVDRQGNPTNTIQNDPFPSTTITIEYKAE